MIYMIWLTSDWHYNHDKEFIWKARGFTSVQEMNEDILRRHNEVVKPNDTVYVLGDMMLGGGEKDEESLELMSYMNGDFYLVCGNHDTPARRMKYSEHFECERSGPRIFDALTLNYNGYHFYLSHYPTITSNLEKESLKQCVINLFGHTHQINNFFYDIPMMYHVGVDSHNCYPVSIDTIIEDIKKKVEECKQQL